MHSFTATTLFISSRSFVSPCLCCMLCRMRRNRILQSRWPATSWVHYTTSCNTQSSASEDGQNNFPKHVELTGIINKQLLLRLVGCLYYLYFIIYFLDLLNNLNLNYSHSLQFMFLLYARRCVSMHCSLFTFNLEIIFWHFTNNPLFLAFSA